MVPDAAWPGSDQWPWGTAPATGPTCRLGRPSASDPGGVVLCALSLCCPRCVCVCGVLGHLARVHQYVRPLFSCAVATWRLFAGARAVCGMCVLLVALSGTPPSFLFCFLSVFVFFWCPRSFVCALFFFLSRVCLLSTPLRQHSVIVVLLRIQQFLICNFCMGLLTYFLCGRHFQMRIPNVLVVGPHRHAKLDPELTLRQRGLLNSCLLTLHLLVMVAPCSVPPPSFGHLQRKTCRRSSKAATFPSTCTSRWRIMTWSERSLFGISVASNV